jgi:hypothetical protein
LNPKAKISSPQKSSHFFKAEIGISGMKQMTSLSDLMKDSSTTDGTLEVK